MPAPFRQFASRSRTHVRPAHLPNPSDAATLDGEVVGEIVRGDIVQLDVGLRISRTEPTKSAAARTASARDASEDDTMCNAELTGVNSERVRCVAACATHDLTANEPHRLNVQVERNAELVAR